MRRRRSRHAIWAVIVLTVCALMTPVFYFYPRILKTVSPKAYAAYACGRTADALSGDRERARAAWGGPAWEALLREPSYLAADLTFTDIKDTLAEQPPFPQGLRWRNETWRDGTSGTLSVRHTLDWETKTFFWKAGWPMKP